MTTSNSNSNEQDNDSTPLFEEFKWHHEDVEQSSISGRNYAELAGMVRDISSGCSTILEMIEFDYLQDIAGEKKIMSDAVAGNLTRLAIQSLTMLNNKAEDCISWAYEYHTEAGKAEIEKGSNNNG